MINSDNNKYIHLTNIRKVGSISIIIDNEIYDFLIKNDTTNLFNIPISNKKHVEIKNIDSSLYEYNFSDEYIISDSQKQYDEKNNVTPVYFKNTILNISIEGNVVNPKKILVTFPSQGDLNGIRNFVTKINSIFAEHTDNVMMLAFQDKCDIFGSFFISDINDNPSESIVYDFINQKLKQFGLLNSDLIFYGNSKGAYLSNKYANKHIGSKALLVVPPINIQEYTSMPDFATYAIQKYRLKNETLSANCLYYFSEMDKETMEGVDFSKVNNYIISNRSTHNDAAKNTLPVLRFFLNNIINEELPSILNKIDLNPVSDEKINFVHKMPSLKGVLNLESINVHLNFEKNKKSVSFECDLIKDNDDVFASITELDYTKYIDAENICEYFISLKVYTISRCYVYPIKYSSTKYAISSQKEYFSIEVSGFKNKQATIVLENDKKVFRTATHTNRVTKYTNLKTEFYDYIDIDFFGYLTIKFHDELYYTIEQMKYNYKFGIEIPKKYYAEKVIGEPKNMIITFPGMSTFNNIHHQVSPLSSFYNEFNDIVIISFQDYMNSFGNYMYKNENNEFFKEKVIDIIAMKKKQYGIQDQNIIFYGNSKGGTICFNYLEEFKKSFFFIDGPQINLRVKEVNELIKSTYTDEYLDFFNYTKMVSNLASKNIFYSYSDIDYDSNADIKHESLNINTLLVQNEPHGKLIMKAIHSTKRKMKKILYKENRFKSITINCRVIDDLVIFESNDFELIEIVQTKDGYEKSMLVTVNNNTFEMKQSVVVNSILFGYDDARNCLMMQGIVLN